MTQMCQMLWRMWWRKRRWCLDIIVICAMWALWMKRDFRNTRSVSCCFFFKIKNCSVLCVPERKADISGGKGGRGVRRQTPLCDLILEVEVLLSQLQTKDILCFCSHFFPLLSAPKHRQKERLLERVDSSEQQTKKPFISPDSTTSPTSLPTAAAQQVWTPFFGRTAKAELPKWVPLRSSLSMSFLSSLGMGTTSVNGGAASRTCNFTANHLMLLACCCVYTLIGDNLHLAFASCFVRKAIFHPPN